MPDTLWLPLSLWERGLGGEVGQGRNLSWPSATLSYEGRHWRTWRLRRRDVRLLWLPLSLWERGLGGEVGGVHYSRAIASAPLVVAGGGALVAQDRLRLARERIRDALAVLGQRIGWQLRACKPPQFRDFRGRL